MWGLTDGSLEVKLPTIWADEKQKWSRIIERRRQKKEDQRREKVRRKKMQVREKVGQSRSIVFFPMICGSKGSKSMLAKAAGAEPAGQMRDEKIAREAQFEVKTHKTHHAWTAVESWDVEKVHAIVARSTFQSQNAQNTRGSDQFWRRGCRFAWQAQGIVHLFKSAQDVGLLGHFQKPWQAWGICRWSAKMPFLWQAQYKRHFHQSYMRRSGRWFPKRGCILEHQIFRFAEMILRDRCSTSYDVASFFRARQYFWTGGLEKSQDALAPGRQLCTELSIFDGSLAEFFRFWCCPLWKLKSRRIALFSCLQIDR